MNFAVCVDANAGLRAQQRQKAREKDAVYAQQALKFFNKETSLKRTQTRNLIGYGRDLSDAYVQALYKQGKGRVAVQAAATKFYRNKAYGRSLQGGRSRAAGRNVYMDYLKTRAKVDSVMNATFGRNMAYAQEGARRKYLNKNAKAREALGIPAAYGAPVMLSPTDRFSGFLNFTFQALGTAGALGWQPLTSDRRLKENIKQVGVSPQGYKIYEFNYIGGDVRFRGAMAQDVLQKNPMAVGIDQNHLTVDYRKIDVAMEVV
mgnify:CR=1 FL=1